jgi:flagellin-like hook-associated protein FlgL
MQRSPSLDEVAELKAELAAMEVIYRSLRGLVEVHRAKLVQAAQTEARSQREIADLKAELLRIAARSRDDERFLFAGGGPAAAASQPGDGELARAQAMVATLAAQQERADEVHRGLLATIAAQKRIIADLRAGGGGGGFDAGVQPPVAAASVTKSMWTKKKNENRGGAPQLSRVQHKSIVGLRFSANPHVARQLGQRRTSIAKEMRRRSSLEALEALQRAVEGDREAGPEADSDDAAEEVAAPRVRDVAVPRGSDEAAGEPSKAPPEAPTEVEAQAQAPSEAPAEAPAEVENADEVGDAEEETAESAEESFDAWHRDNALKVAHAVVAEESGRYAAYDDSGDIDSDV